MSITIDSTVGEWVVERPGLARVFEKLGIDYCCGGKKPLADVCRERGLDPATVSALLTADNGDPKEDALDVANLSLSALADHIEQTHHAYLKSELPRLQPLVERIANRHADKNPRVVELPGMFAAFREELEMHMVKEERILFPLIRQIEQNKQDASVGCGISNPIRVMEEEHQHAGDALAKMSELTDGFQTPPLACNTYRAVMHSLAQLEADMHRHVHKENNVLFPRALAAF